MVIAFSNSLFFVGLSFVACVYGCGISTHIEICYRAFTAEGPGYMQSLINKHQDAFQAGSPYPDAFFTGCYNGTLSSVSEDTHWVPWFRVAIDYVRNTYPKPWSDATEKLVVFLYGVACHSIADIVWHASLCGAPNGFIDVEAWVDFNNQREVAHQLVDPGGDVVANYELDLSYIGEVTEWYVPAADLVNIYQNYQNVTGNNMFGMNATMISQCSSILFLGRLAERTLMWALYPKTVGNSTFLQEKYFDFYYGGVSNMATVTQIYWERIGVAFDNGTQMCNSPYNPIDFYCTGIDAEERVTTEILTPTQKPKLPRTNPILEQNLPKDLSEADIEYLPNGAVRIRRKGSKQAAKVIDKQVNIKNDEQGPVSWSSNSMNAQAADTVAFVDFNGDGSVDVLVGVPQYNPPSCSNEGRIFVFYSRNGTLYNGPTIESGADAILRPVAANDTCGGRFGKSIAVLDWNNDGLQDILVGGPSLGIRNNTYSGAIYIFYGQGVSGKTSYNTTPSEVIYGQGDKRGLGWNIIAADVDGDGRKDLVEGSPYNPAGGTELGTVSIFLSKDFASQTVSYVLVGEVSASWFGYSIHYNEGMLFIGAPYFKVGDDQGHGKVYGIRYNTTTKSLNTVFTIVGDLAWDRLGFSLTSGYYDGTTSLSLVATAVTKSTRSDGDVQFTGHVNVIYNVTRSTFSGHKRMSEVKASQIIGVDTFQRVGWAVATGDINGDGTDDLLVSAPLSYKLIENFGAAYAFFGGSNFLYKYIMSSCTDNLRSMSPCISQGADIVYNSGKSNDRFGWGVWVGDVNNDKKSDVFVAAPLSPLGARVGGTVFLYVS
eukprot:PhF_6_TR37036/c0_g1_i2/m.54179/K01127/E3.1.4.50; glycosylphosphatidylinositol phospholipase D